MMAALPRALAPRSKAPGVPTPAALPRLAEAVRT
jgi:hypothetical protein